MKSRGFTILEVLISSALAMFLFFTIFYAIGNIISKAILIEKRVELADELDSRISDFMLTGQFDDSSTTNMSFSKAIGADNIQIFTAVNENFDLQIIKRAYAESSVADIITQQLGAYMQKANEIYINAGVSVIDDPLVIADINIARQTYLSSSTEKHSSSTMVLLNLGNTQLNTTQPLEDPPFDFFGAYIIVGPMTNADVTSSGIKWHCTPYGFTKELLPSWCVL